MFLPLFCLFVFQYDSQQSDLAHQSRISGLQVAK